MCEKANCLEFYLLNHFFVLPKLQRKKKKPQNSLVARSNIESTKISGCQFWTILDPSLNFANLKCQLVKKTNVLYTFLPLGTSYLQNGGESRIGNRLCKLTPTITKIKVIVVWWNKWHPVKKFFFSQLKVGDSIHLVIWKGGNFQKLRAEAELVILFDPNSPTWPHPCSI